MVICPRCGARQDDSAKFCSNCTEPLTSVKNTYIITHDIVIGGQMAFGAGEVVIVEFVSPNSSRPEYKYVVTSGALQRKYQLSDNDLIAVRKGGAPQDLPQSVPQTLLRGRRFDWNKALPIAAIVCWGFTFICTLLPWQASTSTVLSTGISDPYKSYTGITYINVGFKGGLASAFFITMIMTIVFLVFCVSAYCYIIARGPRPGLLITAVAASVVELILVVISFILVLSNNHWVDDAQRTSFDRVPSVGIYLTLITVIALTALSVSLLIREERKGLWQ